MYTSSINLDEEIVLEFILKKKKKKKEKGKAQNNGHFQKEKVDIMEIF